jgi:hypothetical protein
MNWDAIGAVGEMIGALAVVVTLAYLALQVRASTRESESNSWTVTGHERNAIRGQFMEHADVWAKGISGAELSRSEQIVFDELVMSRADHHFYAFGRSVVRGGGRERLHVSELARFLHEHPAAYARWGSFELSIVRSRARLSVPSPGRVSDRWVLSVTEAVTALEGMEESAPA